MKRIWMHVGVTVGSALITGAIVSACAHNNASVFIRQVFAPTIPTNGACTFTADITQASLSGGLVDLSYSDVANYTPVVLIGNQIVSQGNANALQAETSRVLINGAITQITDLAGGTSIVGLFSTMCADGDKAACATGKALQTGIANGTVQAPVNPFSTVESTAIEPASSSTASYNVLALTLVDGTTVSFLRQYFEQSVDLCAANVAAGGQAVACPAFSTSIQLLTYTKVEGSDLGNDTVESNEFEFPVTFTYGQLVANLDTITPSAADPLGYCLVNEMVPTMLQTCVPGQDAPALVNPGTIPNVFTCPKLGDAGLVPISAIDAGGG